MLKIYAPNIKGEKGVSGGHTFYRNFLKGMKAIPDVELEFVNSWQECDLFFITGITIVDMTEVREAHKAGKRIVLRADNVPKKSRNRRSSPHERLKEIAEMSHMVIYQSEWAKRYCEPLCGDGQVVYNGVDTEIFHKPASENPDRKNNYLFLYHGNSELKQFWKAHYIFQMEARKNPKAKFFFVYEFGRDLPELVESNFDFWNGEKYEYIPRIEDPMEVADLMRECGTLIFPSIVDASPNTILEARACGMEVIGLAEEYLAGSKELMKVEDISSDRMCEEYFGMFNLAMSDF